MSATLADAAMRLTRPDVPPTELAGIAAAFPDLRPAVTGHPNCYPELRAWIAQVTPPAAAPAPPAPAPIVGPPAPPMGPPTATPGSAAAPTLLRAPTRRARLPWIVAAVAAVVALASVGALVVTRPDASGPGGVERGFATPEDAVDHVVSRVAAGDLGGASEAFAVESLVDGFSYQAFGERIGAVTPQTWLPTSSDGYRAIDVGLRRGEVARQLQFFVQAVVAPERDFTLTQALGDELTAAGLEAELDPEGLADLTVMRVDELNREGDRFSENFRVLADSYGADELREVAVLYGTADGPALGGMQLLRYGDAWYVWGLTSALMGTSIGGLEPITEQDYAASVAQMQN